MPRIVSLALLMLLAAPGVAWALPPTVAVIYFDYQGKDEELAQLKKGLASMLISDLAGNEGFQVVERERLQEVLGELKLQASASIDQTSAVKAGKLLGARFLVLGSYFDVLKKLRVDARIVEVETGRVVQSVGGAGQPEEFLALEQKLAADLGKHLSQVASAAPAAKPAAKTGRGKLAQSAGDAGVPLAKRAKPPKKLDAKTAADYGRALSALDARDVEAAKSQLRKVVASAPDFELASLDLNRLMKQ